MSHASRIKSSLSVLSALLLGACSTSPFVEDWDRDRITEIPSSVIEVSICFDMNEHGRTLVTDLARKECSARIRETQTLVQHAQITQSISTAKQAEGQAFSGPVEREKRINAMLETLKLVYVDNDKWECPLTTPNRVTYECRYNPKAQDSGSRQKLEAKQPVSPDLPPELPDDLKPQ